MQRPESARPTGAPHRAAAGLVNAYTYDGVGNLKSMTDATGTVSYGYNAVNLATGVVEPGGFTTTFADDDDDNRTLTTYPNGVIQRAAYDVSDRLTRTRPRRRREALAAWPTLDQPPGPLPDNEPGAERRSQASPICRLTASASGSCTIPRQRPNPKRLGQSTSGTLEKLHSRRPAPVPMNGGSTKKNQTSPTESSRGPRA